MGLDLHSGIVQLKITSLVCSTVAVILTVARLHLRRKRLWWDDAFAFFSMICVFVQIASAFMHVGNPDELPKTSRVAAYYILASSFYAIIWSARLAILFSILRIEPVPANQQRLRWVAAVFGVASVVLISQLYWVCEPEGAAWMDERTPQCHLNTQVAVCQVLTDVLSDLFLCIWPLRIISGLRDGRLKRRLKVIFCTSIITTVVSLIHVGYLLTIGGTTLLVAAIIENTVSLMVADIPVLFTSTLRVFGSLDSQEEHQNATTFNATSMRFKSTNAAAAAAAGARPASPSRSGLRFRSTVTMDSLWSRFTRTRTRHAPGVETGIERGTALGGDTRNVGLVTFKTTKSSTKSTPTQTTGTTVTMGTISSVDEAASKPPGLGPEHDDDDDRDRDEHPDIDLEAGKVLPLSGDADDDSEPPYPPRQNRDSSDLA